MGFVVLALLVARFGLGVLHLSAGFRGFSGVSESYRMNRPGRLSRPAKEILDTAGQETYSALRRSIGSDVALHRKHIRVALGSVVANRLQPVFFLLRLGSCLQSDI